MVVAEPTLRARAHTTDPVGNLLKALDRALAEENAPVRSYGPGILTLTGLVVRHLLSGSSLEPTATRSHLPSDPAEPVQR